METLSGKVAIITGASSGIGAATARLLARHGCKLAIADINREGLENVAEECRHLGLHYEEVLPIMVDMAIEGDVKSLASKSLEHFGKVNILVNNAGEGSKTQFQDCNTEILDKFWILTVRNPCLLTQLLLPHLEKNNGSVVNMASIYGFMAVRLPDYKCKYGFNVYPVIAYSIAKAAMIHMTKCMAFSMQRTGARFNSLSPGHVHTHIHHIRWLAEDPSANVEKLTNEYYEEKNRHAACGRVGTPEEVAQMIAFLASDACPYLNGQNIVVDGTASITMKTSSSMK